jgi:hypothetical protein
MSNRVKAVPHYKTDPTDPNGGDGLAAERIVNPNASTVARTIFLNPEAGTLSRVRPARISKAKRIRSMSKPNLDETAMSRFEDARNRFHEAMRKAAPYAHPKEVEEPRAADLWRNGTLAMSASSRLSLA